MNPSGKHRSHVTKVPDDIKMDFVSALTNPVVVVVGDALKFLIDSKKQGLLLGVSKDSQGSFASDSLPISGLNELPHPFLVTFHFAFSNGSYVNHYALTRMSKIAKWKVQKAWQTDARGVLTKKWRLKAEPKEKKRVIKREEKRRLRN